MSLVPGSHRFSFFITWIKATASHGHCLCQRTQGAVPGSLSNTKLHHNKHPGHIQLGHSIGSTMRKAMISISHSKQKLVSAWWLSVWCGPPQTRCSKIIDLMLPWSAWSLPSEMGAPCWGTQSGCGSHVLYLGTWQGSHLPGLGQQTDCTSYPITLLPSGWELGHVSS